MQTTDDTPIGTSLGRRDKYEQAYRTPHNKEAIPKTSPQDKALRRVRELMQAKISRLEAALYTVKRRYRAALSLLPPETSDELRERIRNPLDNPKHSRKSAAAKLRRSELVRLVELQISLGHLQIDRETGKIDVSHPF